MELQILNAIQSIHTSVLDVLMPLISNGVYLWFILPAILLIRKNTRKAGLIVLAAIVMDVILCNFVLKNVFQRVRPCDVNTAVSLLVPRPSDYSFPSGHTALSFAAVSGFWFSGVWKKLRIPLLVFACLIAFSRMYMYLHYPTDVLMGIVAGVFCGWAASRLVQRLAGKKKWEEQTA